MEFHHSQGNHIILSIEGMSRGVFDMPHMYKILKSLFQGWNIRFVTTYRHYFEWLYSLYFQEHVDQTKWFKKWES
jgi:hypothetical protein